MGLNLFGEQHIFDSSQLFLRFAQLNIQHIHDFFLLVQVFIKLARICFSYEFEDRCFVDSFVVLFFYFQIRQRICFDGEMVVRDFL